MTVVKVVSILVLVVAIGILVFLNYIGFFSKVTIEEKSMGPYMLVYEEHKGDYKGTQKIQNHIYDALIGQHDIQTFKGFGIYYDDPKKVAKEDLRSIAGCILEENDYPAIERLQANGFNIKEVASGESMVVEFPYKNPFSVFIGIVKVYPELNRYVESKNMTPKEVMEIYDIPARKIIYIMSK
jgi:DNA gyrase inhibitor GyrI